MKQKQKLERFFCQYENVINDNITKEFFKSKSPHVILSNKTFDNIKLNVIMLTKPMIDDVSRNRKIFYDIKYMGGNIQKTKKGKYYNLNPSSTSRNIIFIAIAFHEVDHLENLIFFTEKGEMIQKLSENENRHGYVLLATIQINKRSQEIPILLSEKDIQLTKKFYINQVKQQCGNYHFGTAGTIFGLGYGPKCHQNQHGHSIDRFSNSKYLSYSSQVYYLQIIQLNYSLSYIIVSLRRNQMQKNYR